LDLETKRQFIHMSGLATPFYLLIIEIYFGNLAPIFLLAIMLIIGYSLASLYSKGVKLPLFSQLIDMAERKRSKVTPGRGTLRFYTGVLIAYILMLVFNKPYFMFASAVLVLAMGDSASTLVGVRFGKNKIPYNKNKSIEGAVAGFSFAFIGIFLAQVFIFAVSPLYAVIISVSASFIGMLIESLPIPVDDNLSIPVATIVFLSIIF